MQLDSVPEHLLVLGGGYIACELGQMFHQFGARLTIIQHNAQLVPNEEAEVIAVLEQAYTDAGINLLLKSEASSVQQDGDAIRLRYNDAEGKLHSISGSHLLVAVGRQSNGDTLNLAAAGIEIDDKGNIKVDDYLETNVRGIYAVGDANGQQPFTPAALEEGKVAYTNAFGDKRVKMQRDALGHAIFTAPEIGSVGLTEQQARAQGYAVVTHTTQFASVAKANYIGQTRGFIKYVVAEDTHKLLGCHIIGPQAADLVYDAVIVMRSGGTIHDLAPSVAPFPTLQGGMQYAAEQLLNKYAPKEIAGPLVTAPTKHRRVLVMSLD